jgi:hypothetical protein
VALDSDQCGRVTEVALVRTAFAPEGATQTGSAGALKELVLRRQRDAQDPDRFAPRRVDGGSGVPDCVHPGHPTTLAAGATIQERWELPFESSRGLAEVGSANTLVRGEAVESLTPDQLTYLDFFSGAAAEARRAGRNAVVALPTSSVLVRDATRPDIGPSLGQRFDRMLDDDAFRAFVDAQPVASWRLGDLSLTGPDAGSDLVFRAITTGFERAVTATVSGDGSTVRDLHLPGPPDRIRSFERRPATLPPGISVIPEPGDPMLSDDLIADRLALPSGRVVADASLAGGVEPISWSAAPGTYRVHVTLVRYPDGPAETVAFASLVVSDAPTVTWQPAFGIAVDGGAAAFTSAEASDALGAMIAGRESDWMALQEVVSDSLIAHDDLITEYQIGNGLDLVEFSSGFGDGQYEVRVGLDASGRPTRYVIDFGVLHLAWSS